MNNIPMDQYCCKIHEHFRLRLQGLKIQYDSYNFWGKKQCVKQVKTYCWNNQCENCANAMRMEIPISLDLQITWKEWENVTIANNNNVEENQACTQHYDAFHMMVVLVSSLKSYKIPMMLW